MDKCTKNIKQVPSNEELLSWAEEEQFFLFCDEEEFLQIAKAVIQRFCLTESAEDELFWLTST
ncbi:hypothetical protein M316_0031 [Nitrincola phage 1M3-16]|uniref:hypothetical protein n=1 Tax=Nitrincola phage 1M3-16 TaxID=1472912 RepID=UPI000444E844|nr:hypothetical protein GJ22_gp121 [Nitrincola phage 1M3-16]AHX01096.1 hypothetical protein M316_0031 [Nitrincola phage 1M3-16]